MATSIVQEAKGPGVPSLKKRVDPVDTNNIMSDRNNVIPIAQVGDKTVIRIDDHDDGVQLEADYRASFASGRQRAPDIDDVTITLYKRKKDNVRWVFIEIPNTNFRECEPLVAAYHAGASVDALVERWLAGELLGPPIAHAGSYELRTEHADDFYTLRTRALYSINSIDTARHVTNCQTALANLFRGCGLANPNALAVKAFWCLVADRRSINRVLVRAPFVDAIVVPMPHFDEMLDPQDALLARYVAMMPGAHIARDQSPPQLVLQTSTEAENERARAAISNAARDEWIETAKHLSTALKSESRDDRNGRIVIPSNFYVHNNDEFASLVADTKSRACRTLDGRLMYAVQGYRHDRVYHHWTACVAQINAHTTTSATFWAWVRVVYGDTFAKWCESNEPLYSIIDDNRCPPVSPAAGFTMEQIDQEPIDVDQFDDVFRNDEHGVPDTPSLLMLTDDAHIEREQAAREKAEHDMAELKAAAAQAAREKEQREAQAQAERLAAQAAAQAAREEEERVAAQLAREEVAQAAAQAAREEEERAAAQATAQAAREEEERAAAQAAAQAAREAAERAAAQAAREEAERVSETRERLDRMMEMFAAFQTEMQQMKQALAPRCVEKRAREDDEEDTSSPIEAESIKAIKL